MEMVESCVLARLTGVQREWRACKLKFQFDTYPTMMEMFWLLQIFDLNQKPNHGKVCLAPKKSKQILRNGISCTIHFSVKSIKINRDHIDINVMQNWFSRSFKSVRCNSDCRWWFGGVLMYIKRCAALVCGIDFTRIKHTKLHSIVWYK